MKRYMRIARRTLWYSLAALVVIVAVAVSLLRVFLPDLTAYRDDLEKLASTFLDHTVRIETMDARLVGFTPTLIFDDVYMLDKTGERELVRFEQARIGIALFDSISEGRVIPRDFVVEGIQLAITRHEDGRFSLQGVDVADLEKTFQPKRRRGSGELADWLFKRSRLALRNSTIIWKDLKQDGNTLQFDDVNLVLRNRNERHQLNGQIKLPERMGRQFEIALDVNGNLLNPREMSGQIYMRGDAVQLDRWGVKPKYKGVKLNTGIADFQIWGNWENNRISRLSGDLTAYDLDLSLPVMDESYHVRLMGGLFDVVNDDQGWELNVDRFQYMSAGDVWPETRFRVRHRLPNQQQAARWQIDTDYFRIEDVSSLLLRSNLLDKRQKEMLQTMQPSGDVRELHVRFDRTGDTLANYRVQSRFEHFSSKPWRKLPGLNGFDGQVYADSQRGRVRLDSDYATFEMPGLFREPLSVNHLRTTLHWSNQAHHWLVQSRGMELVNDHVEMSTDLLLSIPKRNSVSPYLDLQARFKNGKAQFAERYYPVGIMKPKLVEWLDRGIVEGFVPSGGVVYNGRLKDFPFRNNQGQFKVAFDARDAVLDYREQWPVISGIDLSAEFTGQGMEILTRQGRLFETRLSPSRVSIADFRNARLQLQIDANGPFVDVARFLTDSPVAPGGRHFVRQTKIGGRAHTRFEAMIPLGKRIEQQFPTRYEGKVTISNGRLGLAQGKLNITGIAGPVNFDQQGVTSRELQAQLQDEPMTLHLETRQSPDGRRQINVLANGRVEVAPLITRFMPRWEGSVSGSTSWHGALVLETGKAGTVSPLLRIDTTLEGVRSDLPAPLNKSQAEVSRLLSEVSFDSEQRSRLSITLGDILAMRLQLNHQQPQTELVRGVLHFGAPAPALPDERVLLVTGALDEFDIASWRDLDDQQGRANGRPVWRDLSLPVRVAMQRLTVNSVNDSETDSPPLPASYPPPPADLPTIRGHIEQLRYDQTRLGRLEFDVRPLQKGLRLERLLLQGDNLRLNASGDWWYRGGRHTTGVNYELTSPSLGRLLDSFGFSAIIDGGKLQSRGELRWPAPPTAFTPALLSGNSHLLVENGSIVKVKPGAGRLLGLFSLSALPRRLMLDFRDTFREGFSFDRMEGEFSLREGNAYSEPLLIESPVAEIRIEGRTGLAAQDFEQQVTVVPRVGDTLPVAGGLLFGTQVGAAILFLEKLIGGVDEASAKRYRITGSWEDPVITELDSPER